MKLAQAILLGVLLVTGCIGRPVEVSAPPAAAPSEAVIRLSGAGNEWLGVLIDSPTDARARSVRLSELRPADDSDRLDDALRIASVQWSRVVTLAPTSAKAVVPLAESARLVEKAQTLWLDLRIDLTARPGRYAGSIEFLDGGNRVVETRPVELRVHDFVLGDSRQLALLGHLDWLALTGGESSPRPTELSRTNESHRDVISTLDAVVTIAGEHFASVEIEGIGPRAKWRTGLPVELDWRDHDELTRPWYDGIAMPDREAPSAIALPRPPGSARLGPAAKAEFLGAVASHFDGRGWLDRAVWFERDDQLVAGALASHPRLIAASFSPDGLLTDSGLDRDRLLALAPGRIGPTPIRHADQTPARSRWIDARERLTAVLPPRLAGALAFVRDARLVRFGSVLPDSIDQLDAIEQAWFVPGTWVGAELPVPTMRLKALRRAQQDFEYLRLATVRGAEQDARDLARLMARPIDLQPSQSSDPIYRHLSRVSDDATIDRAMALVAEVIESRRPDGTGQASLDIARARWTEPQEDPVMLPRSTRFAWRDDQSIGVEIGVDVYNPRDPGPDANTLAIRGSTPGWRLDRSSVSVPQTARDAVGRIAVDAVVEPAATSTARSPLSIELTDGYTGRTTRSNISVPVRSISHVDRAPTPDGLLGDWTGGDQIHTGPLTALLGSNESVVPDAILYAAWTDDAVHLAFRVESSGRGATRSSFVERIDQRPHADDVVEIVIAGDAGLPLRLAVRPTGVLESSAATLGVGLSPRYGSTLQGRIWRGEVVVPIALLGDVGRLVRLNITQHRPDLGLGASWAGPIEHGGDAALTGALRLDRTQ
jgi:hypothetical protein